MGCSGSKTKVGPAEPDPTPPPPETPSDEGYCEPRYLSFNSFFNEVSNPQVFEYRFLRSIGCGSHAEVYLVEHTETHQKYAAKVYSKAAAFRVTLSQGQMIDKIEHEIEIMRTCSHPNVVHLEEALDDEDTDSIILIITYAEHGSVLPQKFTSDPIPEARCCWLFAQMLHAVRAIHAMHVIHRDIKPENILIGNDDHVYLADFSAAKALDPDTDLIADTDGTPAFYSPEECRGEMYHAKPAEVWSLGVSLYLMVFGHLPFYDQSQPDSYAQQLFRVFRSIQEAEVKLDPAIEVSENLADLIVKLLEKNAEARLTIAQALEHPWVVSAGYDPEKVRLPAYLKR
jgi:serine/threonine protein kinase